MKHHAFRFLLTLACVLTLVVGSMAQEADAPEVRPFGDSMVRPPSAPPATGNPALQFNVTDFDFGIVDEGAEVTVKYETTNTSDHDVKIVKFNTGCGCTVAQGNPESIKAGETVTLQAVYHTKGRRGNNARTMVVETDDPGQREYRLTFKGKVRSRLFWSTAFVDFKEVMVGNASTQRLSLISAMGDRFKVERLEVDDPRITAVLEETKPYSADGVDGTEYRIVVTLPEDYPISTFAARLSAVTNAPNESLPPVQIRGSVVGDLVFSPARLYGRATPDMPTSTTVLLHTRSGEPFEVVEIYPDETIPVKITIEAGDTPSQKKIVGTFTPDASHRTRQGSISIKVKQAETDKTYNVTLPVIMVVQQSRATVVRPQTPQRQDPAKQGPAVLAPTPTPAPNTEVWGGVKQ